MERREASLRSVTGKGKIKRVNEKSHTEHPGKALEPHRVINHQQDDVSPPAAAVLPMSFFSALDAVT